MQRHCSLTWSNGVETKVFVSLDIDGAGMSTVNTGHRILDHLIQIFARYGRFNIEVTAEGDGVFHHLFEHTGAALGLAISSCLGDRYKLRQFARAAIPMNETIVDVALDLNHNMGGLFYRASSDLSMLATHHDGVETFCYLHLLERLLLSAKINLHILALSSKDVHHAIEALYKSTAVALYEASRIDDNPINRLRENII